jgi:TRIAP1/MDM35 family protein
MASSLSEECTPLKQIYDTCFNAWFEGYLEPAVAAAPADRAAHSKRKADEYEAKCGQLWTQYKACIDVRPYTPGVHTDP